MDRARLQEILGRFADLRIMVFGDFFLDRYLEIDPALNEISIETGKTAYQVTGKRPQPGAAGTVCNNLCALGVGHLSALTVIGNDGEGYELKQALTARHIDINPVIVSPDRFTPTYTKPMLQHPDGEEELNRQDTKNRTTLPESLEKELENNLREWIAKVDAVILADQVQERTCGVLTDRLRDFIAALAGENASTLIFADSRERIGEFRNVTIKPNRFEAVQAVHPVTNEDVPTSLALDSAETLRKQNGKPVFLTLDREGICPVVGESHTILPIPPVTGPIDIVGAGDSVTAGIVSALASGASPVEASIVGNLVASITIRQIGTTGTATPQQVLEAFEANRELYEMIS